MNINGLVLNSAKNIQTLINFNYFTIFFSQFAANSITAAAGLGKDIKPLLSIRFK